MKKRILPICLIVLPYVYLVIYVLGVTSEPDPSSLEEIFNNNKYYLLAWILLFLLFLLLNIIFDILNIIHNENSKFFLFWSMLIKVSYIPIYLLNFLLGVLCASLPGCIIFVPFIVAFDYMLLLLTSTIGIGGIIQAQRQNQITKSSSVILGILHLFFCTDVVCAIVAFRLVKKNEKKQRTNDCL